MLILEKDYQFEKKKQMLEEELLKEVGERNEEKEKKGDELIYSQYHLLYLYTPPPNI
jgi:hypothetical protein